jgi:hypothetical protein
MGVPNIHFIFMDIQKFHPSYLISLLSTMQCGGSRAVSRDLGTSTHYFYFYPNLLIG